MATEIPGWTAGMLALGSLAGVGGTACEDAEGRIAVLVTQDVC